MGKRLMAKCRMLLQENDELGKMISSGRTAKLEAEIALHKTMVAEMKTNQDGVFPFFCFYSLTMAKAVDIECVGLQVFKFHEPLCVQTELFKVQDRL